MNWFLGLVGALLGVLFWDSDEGFAAIVGFLVAFILVGQVRMAGRFTALTEELKVLRGRLAAYAATAATHAPAQPAAPASPSPASPSAPASPPPLPAAASPITISAAATSAGGQASAASVPQGVTHAPASAAASATASGPRGNAWTPPPPSGPNWMDHAVLRAKAWFTEGNVPVKIGVLVLLFGVAAALRYAAAQGYFTMPIEVRLAVIAAAALAGMAWGWRERLRRPAFGLSLQGGAIGVLLLTVFAAFRLYALLPPMAAFAMVVLLVAGAALLAVLQDAIWLALLGFLGGYLAPVLISTGSANHVGLFSYYAVLNAAVFAISWRRSWRLLNLLGFGFTFGVGAAWGATYYRPELFASVEPFLVLFFLFYIVIGLVYVLRQSEHKRPWVDGTLVFGTPLVAFPMQAALLKDDSLGLAFSAIVVALVYVALVVFLRRRPGERLLSEAYGALALGFATLAVPLAFSASTTASVWALEGAGAAWLGLRQGRRFPWLAGLALQLLAAGSYLISLDHRMPLEAPTLLLNATWLGAAMLSFSGFALGLIHERHAPRFALPAITFWWGMLWWAFAGLSQLDLAERVIGEWRFAGIYVAISLGAAAALRIVLRWPRLDAAIATCSVTGLLLVAWAQGHFGQPVSIETWAVWLLFVIAWLAAMRALSAVASNGLAIAHLAGLWTLASAMSLQAGSLTRGDGADVPALADGWRVLAASAPLALMLLFAWRRPARFAWPRAAHFPEYRWGWLAPAAGLLALGWISALFAEGASAPLLYIPVLNPLELSLLGVALLLYSFAGAEPRLRVLREAAPLVAFAALTMATLRAVHHLNGDPWSPSLLGTGVAQASLTVAWSLLGVGAWILGSRRGDRRIWWAGAALMGIVLVKLLLVDRQYMGNMAGIVSFMAVGLLLVGVGYVAPTPARRVMAQDEP
ncbi:DUF2339 domain-containing protein [soil metagenome]